jgi:hypothetical protein
MPGISSLDLKHQDVAIQIAQDFLKLGKDAEEHTAFAVEHCKESDGIMKVLAPRTLVLESLGAAYFLRDRVSFAKACHALLTIAPAVAARFNPDPMVILNELALAIARADRSISSVLAAFVRRHEAKVNPADIETYQAMILAALVDLDLEDAAAFSEQLIEACTKRVYTKTETEQALPWAQAARLLSRGEKQAAFDSLKIVSKARCAMLNRELGRISKGASSGLLASQMCDLPTAALARLIIDFGYSEIVETANDLPFSDLQWIGAE